MEGTRKKGAEHEVYVVILKAILPSTQWNGRCLLLVPAQGTSVGSQREKAPPTHLVAKEWASLTAIIAGVRKRHVRNEGSRSKMRQYI